MSIEAYTDAIAELQAVAIRQYARPDQRRREVLEVADQIESEVNAFLGALGRIAIGSRTILSDQELSIEVARGALARCIRIAEEALGAKVTAANDG